MGPDFLKDGAADANSHVGNNQINLAVVIHVDGDDITWIVACVVAHGVLKRSVTISHEDVNGAAIV